MNVSSTNSVVQSNGDSPKSPVRAAFIGCGGMARFHLNILLRQPERTQIVALCDPVAENYAAAAALFTANGQVPPPHVADLETLLADYGAHLDAVFIITPHALHHSQAVACLEAGLDVLLEKPMVMNAREARDLIEVCERTGRLLVVAFNGSLSPQIRTAARMLRTGQLGEILTISAVVWQGWRERTIGTWRQDEAQSGGGFLFDTGAHMLNTVADLAGEPFVEVAAWLDNHGAPVDILGTVSARLQSGALVTMNACGDAIDSMGSEVHVFCSKGSLRTGIWGERLLMQRAGSRAFRAVRVPPSQGAWDQFLKVRSGELANPCPPEVGLRMALLWDAIRASAAADGAIVRVDNVVRASVAA